MGIFNLFRKKASREDFIDIMLYIHYEYTMHLFNHFKVFIVYDHEACSLLSITEEGYRRLSIIEIEYLMFWFLRRHLNESILIEIYHKFLEGRNISFDTFKEQLDLRYKIHDNAYVEFTTSNRNSVGKNGYAIGKILMESIGNLTLLIPEPYQLKGNKIEDVAKNLIAFQTWSEGIKMVDSIIKDTRRKFQIDSFLRGA